MRYSSCDGTTGAPVLTKSLFILALAFSAASAAPVDTSGYRSTLEQGVTSGIYRDVAVGWIDGSQHDTWFYGRTPKPTADSVFEIGAVTEVFTGLLLAQAAYAGKVRLQTPIRELLPADFLFADPVLGAITLQDLATHHSGLPALPPNLMPDNVDDPYADYSEHDLLAFLANYRLQRPLGEYAYSSLDAGLLGYLLGHVYATGFAQALYAQVLHDRILIPLGLPHTTFDDAGLRGGYNRELPSAHWHFGVLAGSGGLRSTLTDLLAFLQLNLRPADSPLRPALLLARQPLTSAGAQEFGLGWNIVETDASGQTWPLVWRASTTGGFSAFIGFRSDRQQALVLLTDSTRDLSALGIAWLKQEPAPPLPPAPSALAPAVFAQYSGLYQVRDGAEIIVRAGTDGLTAQLRGEPMVPLYRDAEDEFDSGAGLGLSFQRVAGKVTSVMISSAGANFTAPRLSDRAPQLTRVPIAPDAKSLSAYAGDYRLDASTLVRIAVRADALSMQLTGRARQKLIAFASDRFSSADGSCEVTFQRDAGGRIVALDLDLAGGERTAILVHWDAPPTPVR